MQLRISPGAALFTRVLTLFAIPGLIVQTSFAQAGLGSGMAAPAQASEGPLEVLDAAPEQPQAPAVDAALHWADWTGDGFVDAWAVQPDGSGLLLQNAGDGTFTDRTPGSGLSGVTAVHQAVWADVNGDGQLDVFMASYSGTSHLFVQTSDGVFADVTRASGLSPHVRPTEAQWVDFDGDGVFDLHITSLRGDVVYRGLGRGQFEEVELGLIPRSGRPGAGFIGLPADKDLVPSGGGTTAAMGSITISSINGTSANSAGSASGICAGTIEDMATGSCISASSFPQMGSLYPLSSDFNVGSNGFVGLGTTASSHRLTVAGSIQAQRIVLTAGTGTAPFVTNSTTRVNNLNADFLDGMSASSFRNAGIAINTGDILNGTIVDADVASNAAIAGTKISPDFGNQGIETNVLFSVGNIAVRGAMNALQANGYLGLAGTDDFDGFTTADWATLDIGAAGISVGGSATDNVGVLGHSNNVGVRGEHSGSPTLNFGELGISGIGVRASGTVAAGDFDGLVRIDNAPSRAFEATGGASTTPAGQFTNPVGGPSLRVFSSTVGATSGDPCLNVNTQNRGSGILLTQSNPTATRPGIDVTTFGTGSSHLAMRVRKSGSTGTGAVTSMEMVTSGATGDVLLVDNAGSGRGIAVSTRANVGIQVERSDNLGDLITASNATDIEFRVSSSGNVSCDGAFTGGGADYAEWLPIMEGEDGSFRKGDVVGVFGGEISHDVEGADTLLVVSTNPCLVGNNLDAETDSREGHKVIAFLGQVPVRMRGAVRAGDLILPSGLNDGTAIAVSPTDLKVAQIGDVIGRAWASARPENGEVHRVLCAVGLERDRVAAFALEAVHAEVDSLRGALDAVMERVEALESAR